MIILSVAAFATSLGALFWSVYVTLENKNLWHTYFVSGLLVLLTTYSFSSILNLVLASSNGNQSLFILPQALNCLLAFASIGGLIFYRKQVQKEQRALSALQRKEALYQDIVESQNQAICRFDAEGTIHFANDTYCQLVNKNKSTLYQSKIYDDIDPVQHSALEKCISNLYKNFVNQKFHSIVHNKKDSGKVVCWDLMPVTNELNHVIEIQAVGLLESDTSPEKSDLERFFGISAELLCIARSDGYFQRVNPGFERTLGWTEVEILSRPFNDFIHPEDRENSTKHLLSTGGPKNLKRFTNRFLCKNGNYRFVEWSSMSSNDDKLFYAVGRDVTEQRIAADELKQSERRFRHLFEDSPDPIIVFAQDGEILDANPEICQLLGIAHQILIKETIETIMPRENWSESAQEFERVESGEVQKFQAICLPLNQEPIPVEVSVSRLYYRSKLSFLFHLRDITERKKSEEALLQSKQAAEAGNRAKSEFLAVMSHEIRTPLNAILGFSQLLYDEVTPDQKTYIERILTGGEHLLSIINDILDYSKMESRKLTLELTEFNISNAIKNIGNMFSARADEKNLKLNVEIDETIPQIIIADKQRLKQVIYNLIGNAFKFTSEGSITLRVENVKTTHKSCHLNFAIIDTGIGIPEDKQAAIFRPFTQVDQGIKRVHEGSGLGLAISQKIIASMGGKIQCKSKPNVGSEFSFELKLKIFEEDLFSHAKRQKQTNADILATQSNHLNLKALVVEDDRSNSYLISKFLKRLGCQIKTAENGKKALEATAKENFDLVIMDVAMPVMNGIEATQQIVKRTPAKDRPHILGITANVIGDCQQECLQAGMNGFLSKPISFKELHGYLMEVYEPQLQS